MSLHLHAVLRGGRGIVHLQQTPILCSVQRRKMRSAHAWGTEGRDLPTHCIVLRPPPHIHRWRGLWVLQTILLSITAAYQLACVDVKRECIACRVHSSWHNSCALWIMTDRAMLTVSHFCTLSFTNEEFCISGRSSFLSAFSRLLLTAQGLHVLPQSFDLTRYCKSLLLSVHMSNLFAILQDTASHCSCLYIWPTCLR